MAFGDGIRRNIAHVDPSERAAFRDAIIQLSLRTFAGNRTETPVGGVSYWYKQDEIHQATHVHGGPEFLPWHRDQMNRFEAMLREINPQLSLHYWDWTQDPRSIPNANLGGGAMGVLNLFTPDFMGYGGSASALIGAPWDNNKFYDAAASPSRDDVGGTAADAPRQVRRSVSGSPALVGSDNGVIIANDYRNMRDALEDIHDAMHGFVNMGSQHLSFRDPFVFLLHSNVDRLFARWQTDPSNTTHSRLNAATIYGTETADARLNHNIEPWSTGYSIDDLSEEVHYTRPWSEPGKGEPHNYKHPSIVTPPCYDTNVTTVEIVNLGTPPVINFNDVPFGETTVRAAHFRVYGCSTVTLRIRAGSEPTAPFSILQVAPPDTGKPFIRDVRIWLAYTAGTAEVIESPQTIVFERVETGQIFTFSLRANAIIRPRVAVMLALDQSGSMDFDAGTLGAKRIDVLKEAANTLMQVIQPNNGVGLIRFDTDAYAITDATYPGLPMSRIGAGGMFDPNRIAAINAVTNHHTNINGATSIGDGLQLARNVLNAVPSADYEQKAIILFTDGEETAPLSIADVAGSIDSRTFAIGLGNESQVNTAKLNALTNGTGGYLLLSGILSDSIDDRFKLSKYFLQILAGVTNNNVILDPSGYIAPDATIKIPFQINEADIDSTVILLTDYPVVDMVIQTPDGDLIDATNASGLGIAYSEGSSTKNYRFTLPVGFSKGNHAGTWYALLTVNADAYKKYASGLSNDKTHRNSNAKAQGFLAHGARYSVVVNTFSNLKMAAAIHQNSYASSSIMALRTRLSEYGLPVEQRAAVTVDITRPDNTHFSLPLKEMGDGVFENTFIATGAGIYTCRFMANGATLRGTLFTREQTLTGAIQQTGDDNKSLVPNGTDGKFSELMHKCCQSMTRFLIVIAVLAFIILLVLLFKR